MRDLSNRLGHTEVRRRDSGLGEQGKEKMMVSLTVNVKDYQRKGGFRGIFS